MDGVADGVVDTDLDGAVCGVVDIDLDMAVDGAHHGASMGVNRTTVSADSRNRATRNDVIDDVVHK